MMIAQLVIIQMKENHMILLSTPNDDRTSCDHPNKGELHGSPFESNNDRTNNDHPNEGESCGSPSESER